MGGELETASSIQNSSEKFYCQKEERDGITVGHRSGIKNGVFKTGERACLHTDEENPVIREKLMKRERELL